jgi:hypothetical protein
VEVIHGQGGVLAGLFLFLLIFLQAAQIKIKRKRKRKMMTTREIL